MNAELCKFLEESIKDERGAIEKYMNEVARVDDPVLKRAIKSIAIDEMDHLEVFEAKSKQLGCERN